jgi:hypothetical protein
LDSLRAIVERLTDAKLNGKFRYRVVEMRGDRVDLQRAGTRRDLPDMIAVSMWPGVSGSHAKLAKGTEVLVAFVDGDRAMPIITNFAPGSVPDELTLGGPSGAAPVARLGDSVTVCWPPNIPFAGTVAGSPFTGEMTILTPASALIEGGRSGIKA